MLQKCIKKKIPVKVPLISLYYKANLVIFLYTFLLFQRALFCIFNVHFSVNIKIKELSFLLDSYKLNLNGSSSVPFPDVIFTDDFKYIVGRVEDAIPALPDVRTP